MNAPARRVIGPALLRLATIGLAAPARVLPGARIESPLSAVTSNTVLADLVASLMDDLMAERHGSAT